MVLSFVCWACYDNEIAGPDAGQACLISLSGEIDQVTLSRVNDGGFCHNDVMGVSRRREFFPVNVGKRETAIERLCMETASMAVFAPGIAVLLSLQQLDIRKVNPQIRAYVNHLHIPQPTYFRPNRLRNKQKDLLFQYPVPLYTYF